MRTTAVFQSSVLCVCGSTDEFLFDQYRCLQECIFGLLDYFFPFYTCHFSDCVFSSQTSWTQFCVWTHSADTADILTKFTFYCSKTSLQLQYLQYKPFCSRVLNCSTALSTLTSKNSHSLIWGHTSSNNTLRMTWYTHQHTGREGEKERDFF